MMLLLPDVLRPRAPLQRRPGLLHAELGRVSLEAGSRRPGGQSPACPNANTVEACGILPGNRCLSRRLGDIPRIGAVRFLGAWVASFRYNERRLPPSYGWRRRRRVTGVGGAPAWVRGLVFLWLGVCFEFGCGFTYDPFLRLSIAFYFKKIRAKACLSPIF